MNKLAANRVRNSNLELYRIIVMLLIVAHHYVVNSGLMDVMEQDPLSGKSLFYYWFGMWGKTGINCFVLITGYFMCQSSITIRKFLKLLLQIEFYKIVIYAIFVLSGYEAFSLKGLAVAVLPAYRIGTNFVSCFLFFYLCIPFLNTLIRNLDKKKHLGLLVLCLVVYTLFGTFPKLHVTMNYVSWFCVLYVLASYVRMYGIITPPQSAKNKLVGLVDVGGGTRLHSQCHHHSLFESFVGLVHTSLSLGSGLQYIAGCHYRCLFIHVFQRLAYQLQSVCQYGRFLHIRCLVDTRQQRYDASVALERPVGQCRQLFI